ncbi:Nicotinamide-nucleotide amidohydrolase PncC [Hartmannibacter diazotrophicus]|uniref:Nicotinamide-nucleotide amidohydrolase PncC n=1 Tax=Hartmannibacter diazotrophicus TaxID=1482074 RepID=A0A2C9D6P1_9HYPH|nr:CinA family protein [Hartmannibacter diazotrophicus]SON55860.1 Nicotinamide-nucleotide amidohydrolase PncC [Hartmannibacter diazotrophicus]
MDFDDQDALQRQASRVLELARRQGLMIATAESCTGGLIAGMLTEIAGSSDVVERGFVTYSNLAKQEMLGVPASLIERVGAVSEEVARAMADGAIRHSAAGLAVSVTGIAGPGGGSAEKPVGLVHFATARRGAETLHHVEKFGDIGRRMVRLRTVAVALTLLEDALSTTQAP